MSELSIEALAYNRRNANKRPIFKMKQALTLDNHNVWQSSREWYGVDTNSITNESLSWDGKLLEVSTYTDSLNETCTANCEPKGNKYSLDTELTSSKTDNVLRRREIAVEHPPITLSSVPLLIAKNWQRLLDGETLYASYIVLKVQRTTGLKIKRNYTEKPNGKIRIDVIPTNPIIRMIFGANTLHFVNDEEPTLLSIHGLLDPRDKKHNGRWHEYFGSIEFTSPWDLSPIKSSGN